MPRDDAPDDGKRLDSLVPSANWTEECASGMPGMRTFLRLVSNEARRRKVSSDA